MVVEYPRNPKWPRKINFEGCGTLGLHEYYVVAFRCPDKGEYYLSGAVPAAYKARQHLTTEYHIVVRKENVR